MRMSHPGADSAGALAQLPSASVNDRGSVSGFLDEVRLLMMRFIMIREATAVVMTRNSADVRPLCLKRRLLFLYQYRCLRCPKARRVSVDDDDVDVTVDETLDCEGELTLG